MPLTHWLGEALKLPVSVGAELALWHWLPLLLYVGEADRQALGGKEDE